MLIKRWLLVLMVSFCSANIFASPIDNTEHIVFHKAPIEIRLPIKQERIIVFPKAITIVDSNLGNHVGLMKVQDALYLNAQDAFVSKRLVVELMPTGEVIVLNISAKEDYTAVSPIEIVFEKQALSKSYAEGEQADSAEEASEQKSVEFNPIFLTRFAIQSLYSPARLLQTPFGISRTPMQTHKTVSMVYGASVIARPLISWKGGDYYVTAVELKNMLNKLVVLDPKKLIGSWQTAAFFPTNTLKARGDEDTTTVFVVSDRPFGQALNQTLEFVR